MCVTLQICVCVVEVQVCDVKLSVNVCWCELPHVHRSVTVMSVGWLCTCWGHCGASEPARSVER